MIAALDAGPTVVPMSPSPAMPIITVLAGFFFVQVPEPPAAGLVWEAPQGCPKREELLAAIDRRLGRPFAGEVEVDARVSLHAQAPRYRLALQISTRGGGAIRTLTSQRCAALVDATALLVATAAKKRAAEVGAGPAATEAEPVDVEPEVTEVPTPEAGSEAESPAPEPAAPEPAPPAPAPGPEFGPVDEVPPASAEAPLAAPGRAERRLGGVLRLQGGPELGALPGVSGAVMLVGGLLWRRARLEARGTFLTPRTEVRPEGTLRAFAGMGAVLGCGRVGPKRVEVPLCGGLEAGGVRGIAQDGVEGARATTGRWLAVVASAGVAVAVHPQVRVGATLEGVAGILVPSFVLRDPGRPVPLFTSSLISGRLLFAVELRFRDPR